MNLAWISARAGRAVVATDSETFLLEAGRKALPKRCAPGQLNNLRTMASDVAEMEAGEFPFPAVKEVLERTWHEQSALDFLLMTLDRDLSDDLRKQAAEVATRLLKEKSVREAVRRRLLGTPLPEIADLEGAPQKGVVAELIREAAENRQLVAIANKTWDRVFWEHFNYSEKECLKDVCIVEGGFAALVCTLGSGNDRCSQCWLEGLKGRLTEPPIPDLLHRWQTTASQVYADARAELLCSTVGLKAEAKKELRASLKEAEPDSLLINLNSLSPKALGGVAAHFLMLHEVRQRRRKPRGPSRRVANLRRKVLKRIGVGSSKTQPQQIV